MAPSAACYQVTRTRLAPLADAQASATGHDIGTSARYRWSARAVASCGRSPARSLGCRRFATFSSSSIRLLDLRSAARLVGLGASVSVGVSLWQVGFLHLRLLLGLKARAKRPRRIGFGTRRQIVGLLGHLGDQPSRRPTSIGIGAPRRSTSSYQVLAGHVTAERRAAEDAAPARRHRQAIHSQPRRFSGRGRSSLIACPSGFWQPLPAADAVEPRPQG